MTRFENLAHLVSVHAGFWDALCRSNPGLDLVKRFLQAEWDPWFARWEMVTADGDPLDDALMATVARDLSALRARANELGIAVPDIGSVGPRAVVHMSQPRTPGAPVNPYGADPTVASINAETDRRFQAQTGHAHIDPKNPADKPLIPVWLSIRYQVAQEVASRAAGGGAQVSGVHLSLDQTKAIVAAHEVLWAQVGQEHDGPVMRWWFHDVWNPWLSAWYELCARGDIDETVLAETAQSLLELRERARERGIPVPDLTPAASPVPVSRAAPAAHDIAPARGRSVADLPMTHSIATSSVSGHHGGGHGRRRRSGGWGSGGWGGYWDGYGWNGDDGDVTVNVNVGEPPMTTTLISGFRGHRFDRIPFRERLVAVAPVFSDPGNGNISIGQFRLEGDTLYGSICVNGRCFNGAINLSELAGVVGDRFATYHDAESTAPPEAVQAAGDALVGALLDQSQQDHQTLCAGWWHSFTHAISHAASDAVGTIGHTLKQLKGPIAAAAGAAAGAACMAIPGGQAFAPMASSLAGSIVNAAAGSGDVKQAAQAVLAQAQQAAQSNPQVAKALAVAQQAVSKAATGYHVVQTVANAAAGNQDAIAQVKELAQSAANGDAAAQQAMQLAQGAADDGSNVQADAVSSGAAVDQRVAAQAAARSNPHQVIGYVKPNGQAAHVQAFASSDDADDWYGQWMNLPHAYEYVAYFDKADPSFPAPLNEQMAGAGVVSSGWFLPFLAGAGIGGAGTYFGPSVYHSVRAAWDRHRAAGKAA